MAKLDANKFAAWLMERAAKKDGYIMCSVGQDPKKLNEWYFSGQYSGKQLEKARYWRTHAERVFDCQGMADGYVTEFGSWGKVNVRARNNYADWCSVKGTGVIPAKHRMPGAAVFKKGSSSAIHHVGYLVQPVDAKKPTGDWYIVEAKGVMYGVVTTKLSDGGWDRWGLMDKYFDYSNHTAVDYQLGQRELYKGCVGSDVKQLQTDLIDLGFDCGSYGADGDFGSATENSVKEFQKKNGLSVDGIAGIQTLSALNKYFTESKEDEPETPTVDEILVADDVKKVVVTGDSVYLWNGHPAFGGEKGVIVHKNDELAMLDPANYLPVIHNGVVKWINEKYVK